MIIPQTDLILLKVPLEINEKNQLRFDNSTAQLNYFNGCTKKTFDTNFTYQKSDGTVNIPVQVDEVLGFNYVMYRNYEYSNRWFFAFVDDATWLSPKSTQLKLRTDVFQTWYFDLTMRPVFVEREHVADDTIGANTVIEGLQVGEYVTNGSPSALAPSAIVKDETNTAISAEMMICFQVTETVGTISVGNTINRTFSGLYFMAVASATDARNLVKVYDALGKANAIVSIFMAPKEFFQGAHVVTDTFTSPAVTIKIYSPADNAYATTLLSTTTVNRPSTVDGYTPKNNKLFTYPYSFIYMTNNAGIDSVYRYEDFSSATPKFYIGGALGQGCSTKLVPVDYKHLTGGVENYPYGMSGAKYPICAWNSDYYTNWLTQNAVNIGTNIVSSTLVPAVSTTMRTGSAGLGLAAAGAGLLGSVINAVGQIETAKIMPDQAHGNVNGSDITFAWRRYFTANKMSVRAEIARIIDDFFSMFGYKVNRVKIPNLHTRANWNYIKTIGCYIRADIPQKDLQEIQNMFNEGLTLWHNPSTFGDYSQQNGII